MSLQSIRRNTSTSSCRPSVLQLNVWATYRSSCCLRCCPSVIWQPTLQHIVRPFNSRHPSGRGVYRSLQLKPSLSNAARSEVLCKTTRRPRCGDDRCIDVLRMRRRTSSGDLTDKYGKGRSKRGTRCRSIIIGLLMIVGGTVLGGFACSRRIEPDTWRSAMSLPVPATNAASVAQHMERLLQSCVTLMHLQNGRDVACIHAVRSTGYSMHGHRP